jgi:epoxyqueuosine reductase
LNYFSRVKISAADKIWVQEKAQSLGFQSCKMARAGKLEEEARYLEHWLNQQQHGKMQYMENHFDKRVDPTLLLPGAQTVISLSYNYFTKNTQQDTEAPKIALYALGKDYHKVVKDKLFLLVQHLQQRFGDFAFKCCVDSVPILEKAWAKRSGLGWIGKHTNLLTKGSGSYFFLAELICDLSFDPDIPVKDYCGSCTRCIDACPTQAIVKPYSLDASRCISYATIELKEADWPESFHGKTANWMFGCDICQQVCPINARSQPHNDPDLQPNPDLLTMSKQDWDNLNETTFDTLFSKSAVQRTGYKGLTRNIQLTKIK